MIHNLDNIIVSPRIEATWVGYLDFAVMELLSKFPDLTSDEIPDEQFEDLGNGNGNIFVTVREKRLSLSVPKGEWKLCQ